MLVTFNPIVLSSRPVEEAADEPLDQHNNAIQPTHDRRSRGLQMHTDNALSDTANDTCACEPDDDYTGSPKRGYLPPETRTYFILPL